MAIVTRRGAHKLADPNAALGAGETSVNSPLRSNLDYESALADTAEQAGGAITGAIGLVQDFAQNIVDTLTGIATDPIGTLKGWAEQIPFVGGLFGLLTGGLNGSPTATGSQEGLSAALSNVTESIKTALNTAAQASDLVKQISGLVTQIVQSAQEPPSFTFVGDAIDAFAFWTLGWFGYTKQANSATNPAIIAVSGRLASVSAVLTSGGARAGFDDHFDRDGVGADWGTHGSYPILQTRSSAGDGWLKSGNTCAGHYLPAHFLTNNWHLQFTFQDMDWGACRIAVGDAAFTDGICVEVEPTNYDTKVRVFTLSGGLGSLGPLRTSLNVAFGVFQPGDVVAIEYYSTAPSASDPANTYYVFHNGVEITELRWTDDGHVTTHDTSHGEVGVMTNVTNAVQFQGPGLDDMSGSDLQVA